MVPAMSNLWWMHFRPLKSLSKETSGMPWLEILFSFTDKLLLHSSCFTSNTEIAQFILDFKYSSLTKINRWTDQQNSLWFLLRVCLSIFIELPGCHADDANWLVLISTVNQVWDGSTFIFHFESWWCCLKLNSNTVKYQIGPGSSVYSLE